MPAQTDPGSGAKKIAEGRKRLDALNDKVDLAVEDYAEGKIALALATTRTELARARVVRSQKQLSKQQARFSMLAGAAYRSGGANAFVSLMTTSSPQTFLDKAQTLDNVARSQALQVQGLRAADRSLRAERAANDKALADQERISAKLEKTKTAIQKDVAEQEVLLRKLEDDEATRIRVERERQIALAEARAEKARQARVEALHRARIAAEAQARLELAGREQQAARAAAAGEAAAADAAAAGRDGEQAAADAAAAASAPDEPGQGPNPPPPSVDPGDGGARASIALNAAYEQLGKRYLWGADGPDRFDCSGLMMWAWARAGVSLPHSSRAQFGSGRHVDIGELRPGDLVFFGSPIHHVGMYVGGGNMIHAPHTGAVVQISNAFRNNYVGAVRL
jgi:cell wall-associated NlpC family hydrolase